MITITVNGLNDIISKRISQLKSIANPANEQDKIARIVALDAQAKIHKRIHEEGKASDGSDIGTYSKGYMAVRTGNFKSNGKISKGKNKGQQKTTGVFTKGKHKGEKRPNFNRTGSTKVVISLTKKLELSYAVKATEKGYGVGFIDASVNIPNYDNDTSSFDKSQYVENTYRKPIFNLTKEEKNSSIVLANTIVNKILKG